MSSTSSSSDSTLPEVQITLVDMNSGETCLTSDQDIGAYFNNGLLKTEYVVLLLEHASEA